MYCTTRVSRITYLTVLEGIFVRKRLKYGTRQGERYILFNITILLFNCILTKNPSLDFVQKYRRCLTLFVYDTLFAISRLTFNRRERVPVTIIVRRSFSFFFFFFSNDRLGNNYKKPIYHELESQHDLPLRYEREWYGVRNLRSRRAVLGNDRFQWRVFYYHRSNKAAVVLFRAAAREIRTTWRKNLTDFDRDKTRVHHWRTWPKRRARRRYLFRRKRFNKNDINNVRRVF